MANLSGTVKKVWVFSVAAALIAGSGVTMNFILGSKTFAENSDRVIQQQQEESAPSGTAPEQAEVKAEYTVIDQSKNFTGDKLQNQLKAKGVPTAQLESRAEEIQSTYIPGEKDLTAEQAATYGAAVLKQVFGADLKGYTARAGFLRGGVPGTDSWSVSFEPGTDSSQTGKHWRSIRKVLQRLHELGERYGH
ncbi:hypothetical protein LJK87_28935 [Paenibacillus sp. P25]|nr:hypothetical protein LJK87_28935 [Paenibacillus sp. P25]